MGRAPGPKWQREPAGRRLTGRVGDALYGDPRLVAVYDEVDDDRSDLEVYLSLTEELEARTVLDLGCGTGVFARLLAGRGLDVTAVDPAAASLDLARRRPGADRVHWVHGDAPALPPSQVDLATMTGNAAQAVVDPADWAATLTGLAGAVHPAGRLVLETRDPADRAWEQWTRPATERVLDIPGVGGLRTWIELTEVALPLVSFRGTYVFAADGAILTSDSTLRFRDRDELAADLVAAGLSLLDIRDAPDRPGRELVVHARPCWPAG